MSTTLTHVAAILVSAAFGVSQGLAWQEPIGCRDVSSPNPNEENTVLLRDFYDKIFRPEYQIGNSWRTDAEYSTAMKRLDEAINLSPASKQKWKRRAQVADLNPANLAAVASMILSRGLAPATADKALRALGTIYRAAVDKSLLPPVILKVKKPRGYAREPRAWTPEEVGRLLVAASEELGSIGEVPAPIFWRAYILTIYDTGARKAATLRLPPSGYYPERRAIALSAETQKQKADQWSMVSEETAEALATLLRYPHPRWLFPWPFDRYPRANWNCFDRHFGRIVDRAGLERSHRMSHRLRVTRATLGEQTKPGSAAATLGHSSPSVTWRHYIDKSIIRDATIDLLPRPVMPGSPTEPPVSPAPLLSATGTHGQEQPATTKGPTLRLYCGDDDCQ